MPKVSKVDAKLEKGETKMKRTKLQIIKDDFDSLLIALFNIGVTVTLALPLISLSCISIYLNDPLPFIIGIISEAALLYMVSVYWRQERQK